MRAEEIIPAEVAIQPHFQAPLAVDAQHFLIRLEVANQGMQLLEAKERWAENVKIFRKRDIVDAAQPIRRVLDVHPRVYSAPAKGFLLDWLEVPCVDDVFLTLSPTERLEILLHFLCVLEDDAVLLNPLISERIDQ